MPEFSAKSMSILKTTRPELQRLFLEVVKHFDCTVISGRRGQVEQESLFRAGKTKAHFGESPHNYGDSFAVDVVPYPIDWDSEREIIAAAHKGDEVALMKAILSVERLCLFAGFVLGTAKQMGIELTWGGDWNRDTHLSDNRFDDFPHFELTGWRQMVRPHV